MTPGQQRAVKELKRIQFSDPDRFEILTEPEIVNDWLFINISLKLGSMELADGGLDLREREDFILKVPPDFPFDKPVIRVAHKRFAKFPHVIWRTLLCLYQSSIEWNPTDSLYGFFDRLLLWLKKAAMNDMDPHEGPLEPPHYNTDFTQLPFVIRRNTPFLVGETWFGLAELKKYPNRMELVAWNDLSGEWPEETTPALVIVLTDSMPIEFPSYGKGLFDELDNQGIDKHRVLLNLRLTAKLTAEGEPAYIVLAIPMRRSPEGEEKFHIAVWSISPDSAHSLRLASPSDKDPDQLSEIKEKLDSSTLKIIELSKVSWCKILEDRDEILVRRDTGTPMSWFRDKKVLILGCGALGSWVAEIISRSNCKLIHLVDNSIVKPGLLVRQNFRLDDIGENKAIAIGRRLKKISHVSSIEGFSIEAHKFITEDKVRFAGYDLVLDCTASSIFQMKLERDWGQFKPQSPALASLIIDGKAKSCIGVVLPNNCLESIWGAYINLKHRLCLDGDQKEILESFYNTEKIAGELFQPEPGCSDPTFVGSTADIMILVSTALNQIIRCSEYNNMPMGISFSSPIIDRIGSLRSIPLPESLEIETGHYRVRVCNNVFTETRGWVKHNNRERSHNHETGGLLWGAWDDTINVIWVFDASGPPPDSSHDPGHFLCGVEGTLSEHEKRVKRSYGTNGFVGFWHTHPNTASKQSLTDLFGMSTLVAQFGQNQKRALMIIFGRNIENPSAGIYIYENIEIGLASEEIQISEAQITMEDFVV